MQVGFVGLGKMGRPMTQRLLAAGHTVHVFNRSQAAIDALAAEGATAAGSAGEVAERAEVVMTALPTPESVEAVYRRDGCARPGRARSTSTTRPSVPGLNRHCAEQLETKAGRLPRRARLRRPSRRQRRHPHRHGRRRAGGLRPRDARASRPSARTSDCAAASAPGRWSSSSINCWSASTPRLSRKRPCSACASAPIRRWCST